MRALALMLGLLAAAPPGPHNLNRNTAKKKGAAAPPQASFRFLPAGTVNEATGAALVGAAGEAITTTRPSARLCARSNGDATALTNNQPCLVGVPGGSAINLALQPESFGVAPWTLSSATINADTAAAPDGSTTADTLNLTDTSAAGAVSQVVQSIGPLATGTYTASVWLKRASGAGSVYLGLTLGTAWGTSLCTVDATWRRCQVTIFNGTASTSWYLFVGVNRTDTSQAEAGSAAQSVYVWGAQLETGSNANTYAKLAPVNSVTNYAKYSEALDNAAWTKVSGLTVAADAATDPNGFSTADSVIAGSSNYSSVGQTFTADGSTYLVSAWVRSASGTQVGVGPLIYDSTAAANICSTNATITTTWQRVSCLTGATVASHSLSVRPFQFNTLANEPQGTVAYVWGAQVEKNVATPSRYVGPTSGAVVTSTTAPALDVSPSITNLIHYSEQINNAAWLLYSSASIPPIIVADTNWAAAPDGTSTADKITFRANGGTARVYQGITTGAAVLYTGSVWARSTVGSKTLIVLLTDNTTTYRTDCAVTNTVWTRCVVPSTATLPAAATWYLEFGYDGTTSDVDFIVWGAQMESVYPNANQYAATTSANVALNRDTVDVASPVTVGATASYAATVNIAANGVSRYALILQDGVTSYRWRMVINTNGTLQCSHTNSVSTYTYNSAATVTGGQDVRLSCDYEGTRIRGCVGATCTTSAFTFTPSNTAYTVRLGNIGGGNELGGLLRDVCVGPAGACT